MCCPGWQLYSYMFAFVQISFLLVIKNLFDRLHACLKWYVERHILLEGNSTRSMVDEQEETATQSECVSVVRALSTIGYNY